MMAEFPHLNVIEESQADRRRTKTKTIRVRHMEMKMSDREWRDTDGQDGDDLGFELREMLSMLDRMESVNEFEGGAIGDFGDEFDLSGFAL